MIFIRQVSAFSLHRYYLIPLSISLDSIRSCIHTYSCSSWLLSSSSYKRVIKISTSRDLKNERCVVKSDTTGNSGEMMRRRNNNNNNDNNN